jgi:transposase
MSAAFIGLDLAKAVFQVHGVDVHGKVVVTQRLRRDAVLAFFATLAPCVALVHGCRCCPCGRDSIGSLPLLDRPV